MQPQLSGATVALSILAGVFAILLPPLVAIAAHTVIDAAGVFLPQALGSGTLHAALATEAVLTGFALLALWTIAALRDRPAPGHSAASGEPSTRAPRPVGA